jgi:hypothetical protein
MRRSLTLAVAIACAAYIAMLVWCGIARIPYPFEVEWMEGGMLTHAARVREGHPIYGPPSTEFVPFFYTPLYAYVVAWLSKVTGALSFALARSVTFGATLATLALVYLAVAREAGRAYGVIAAGFYAASYRFAGTFHDLVRPDALALALAFAATYASRHAKTKRAVVLAAALFVAAFFAKQTSAVLAPFAAILIFTRDKRLGLLFALSGTALGIAATILYDRTTQHWFWFYIFQGHQGHLFYWKNILLEYWRDVAFLAPALLFVPVLAIAWGKWTRWFAAAFVLFIAYALYQGAATIDMREHMYYRELLYVRSHTMVVAVPIVMGALLIAYRFVERAPSVKVEPFWLVMFAAAALSSGLNHSTQWAYSNCFMPIALFGSVVLALALRSFVESAGPRGLALVGAAFAMALAVFAYSPRAQVPDARDRAALAVFEKRVDDVGGAVLIPAHPFEAYARARAFHLHQMGTGDVGFEGGVRDLGARLARGDWKAVIMDSGCALPGLDRFYYESDHFTYDDAQELMPRTGFATRPQSLWRLQNNDEHELAPGISGTFEHGYTGWTATGAFGASPAERFRMSDIRGTQGAYAASSRNTRDAGTLTSAPFVLTKPRITLVTAGASTTYVRVLADGEEIQRLVPPRPPQAQAKSIDLRAHVGKTLTIELVDEGGRADGGIVVDDVRLAD